MDQFVAYPARWRRAMLCAGSAAFVAIGLWMVGAFGPPSVSSRYPEIELLLVGWVCIVFFGACGISWFASLFDTSAQLVIGAEGIQSTRWSAAVIPWHEITNVTTWTHGGQKFIVLHLRDPSRFPGKGVAGLLAAANRKLAGGDISVTLVGTDRSVGEAMSAIGRYRRF